MAQDCRVRDYKEPAVHTKAAQQAEVASNHLLAAAVVAAARIEVAGIGRIAAAVEERAIGSHHLEGMETGCFAVGGVGEAQGRASSRLAAVARARHRPRQQPDVLREACRRCESWRSGPEWVCDEVVEEQSVQRARQVWMCVGRDRGGMPREKKFKEEEMEMATVLPAGCKAGTGMESVTVVMGQSFQDQDAKVGCCGTRTCC